jgi:membrane-bound lytic murein transglycosylase D
MSSSFCRQRLSLVLCCLALAGCATTQVPPTGAQSGLETTRSPVVSTSTPSASSGTAAAGLPNTAALPVETMTPAAPPPLLDLTVAPDDLWQRIRHGFGMPDLHNPLVADRQSWYLNRPDMLRRIFERAGRYLYHIVEELENRGMPTELALLPMVESAYNPQAVSSARAMGMWQFIPSTGKNYQLEQNWWVDERRDIIASTDAALRYLQNIYDMHGDWHLALASYNWGEHAVARAIAKNQAKGLPTDYSSLTMPGETRYYVPKLQALKNIIAQPEVFGFYLKPIPNQPYFETVMKPERIDVAVAARLADIPVEEFLALNPAYHRPVINGNQAGEELLLPIAKIGTFLVNLERYTAADIPLSNWQTYRLKKGETLAKVAARHRISLDRLRQINGITPRVRVGPGFNLLVPRAGSQANPNLMAKVLPKEPPARSVKKKTSGRKAAAKKPAGKKTVKPRQQKKPAKKR